MTGVLKLWFQPNRQSSSFYFLIWINLERSLRKAGVQMAVSILDVSLWTGAKLFRTSEVI